MLWKIKISKKAQKDFDKIAKANRERIMDFLEKRVSYRQNPYDLADPLTGVLSGYCKFRCGNYRIVSKIENEIMTIIVVRVGHRREVYQTFH